MTDGIVVKVEDGLAFEDGDDRGRIVVSSGSTNGAYSVMEWVVAPGPGPESAPGGFGPHRHGSLEETFLVRCGELECRVRGTRGMRAGLLPAPRMRRVRWPRSVPRSSMLVAHASDTRRPLRPSRTVRAAWSGQIVVVGPLEQDSEVVAVGVESAAGVAGQEGLGGQFGLIGGTGSAPAVEVYH
ncbi:MAG: hypothetical protein GY925_23335 [Actinomycetia bacterium]|nr:hypothetical protein [Actinomycetes bacterium]